MAHQLTKWLADVAIPLWLEKGVDWKKGGFFEGIDRGGKPLNVPRRAMVQARQIFSFRVAGEMGVCDRKRAAEAVELGARTLLKNYSDPSGAFAHSANEDGQVVSRNFDLYSQAFCLFGLANAYALNPDRAYADRARALVEYLRRERRAPGGGFTETKEGQSPFQSNPHMHLFEAAIYWVETDRDPVWRQLADEVLDLCRHKFIESRTRLLGEIFDSGWVPKFENGKFLFEPGHQYEWCWLMGRYQRATGVKLDQTRDRLFNVSEEVGVSPERGAAYDQLWSDLSIKSKASRFWPQCERTKAAAQFGVERPAARAKYRQAADQAMATLGKYFEIQPRGLWFDSWEENGEFVFLPAKASSLYHIIGAISEYESLSSASG